MEPLPLVAVTERELPTGVTRMERGDALWRSLGELPLLEPADLVGEPIGEPGWGSAAAPTRFEVPESVVDEDELWTRYAEACGFGPHEERIAFGDGPDRGYVDDFVYERVVGSCDPEDRACWRGGPNPDLPDHEYATDLFEHEQAEADAHTEYERERERILDVLYEAREADLARRASTVLAAPAPVSLRVPCDSRRAPRSRRASRTRSRARSPGRPPGDDDPPSRPPLAARRKAGS